MSSSPSLSSVSLKRAFSFPLRQVHLDFHTSPFIDDVASEFDPHEFATTLKRAHVESVTVFAKCHHGMCYYPTRTGTPHPALGGRDLLGEMIEALHREGLRAPIYTTAAWEEDVAQRFPQWRQMHADGTFGRAQNADPTQPAHPGGWRFNDWSHPDYQDYIEAHTRELCARYPVDGIFYDILFYAPDAHHSDVARALRRRHGLIGDDAATFRRFESLAQEKFCARFTRLLKTLRPTATVFYNSSLALSVDSTTGLRPRCRHVSHLEVESLPSGFWGYYHFPRLARSAGRWGQPWLGMTGRFQKMWGDFGGIKPAAALEYECFRTQALGGGNSVGDQLPPRGKLDRAAYELIGEVYAQCANAEPFYAGSQPLTQVGILTAGHPALDPDETSRSDEGAVQMCDETHYDATVLDDRDRLDAYEVLLLPDATIVTERLRQKLARFYHNGGKLLISYRGGRDAEGEWALGFLPLSFAGEVEKFPTYWRARLSFWPERASTDRVFYARGTNVVARRNVEVLVERVLPYFKRTDLTFSSHFQAPPVAQADRFPAVVAGKNFVYFADPIFREYRQSGNIVARDVWRRTMERLIGPAPYGSGLPTTVLSIPRRRGRHLLLTLLHYIPLRKSIELDVLEERMNFAGEILRLPPHAKAVKIFGTDEELPRHPEGGFALPAVKGRLLLEVPDFFRTGIAPGRR